MPRFPADSTADAVEGEAWSPPAWILSTDPRHSARVAAVGSRSQVNPMFRLKSSKIDVRTYQEIRSKIAGTSSQQREPAFRKKCQLQIHETQRKIVEYEQALEELSEKKKESLEDIETLRKQEMEKEIKALEQKIRKGQQDKVKERKRKLEAQMETEFEERRQSLQKDQERRRAERNKAREDAKSTEEVQPVAEVNEDTEKLKQELADAKAEIDEMNEHKSEMIWLLKQVIKAEEKQKAQTQGERKP